MVILGVQSVWVWIRLRGTRYPLFRVRHTLTVVIILVLVVLFDEGGERAGSAHVDTGFESTRRLSLVSRIGSTGQTLLRAPQHGDFFVLPVDLGVVLV